MTCEVAGGGLGEYNRLLHGAYNAAQSLNTYSQGVDRPKGFLSLPAEAVPAMSITQPMVKIEKITNR